MPAARLSRSDEALNSITRLQCVERLVHEGNLPRLPLLRMVTRRAVDPRAPNKHGGLSKLGNPFSHHCVQDLGSVVGVPDDLLLSRLEKIAFGVLALYPVAVKPHEYTRILSFLKTTCVVANAVPASLHHDPHGLLDHRALLLSYRSPGLHIFWIERVLKRILCEDERRGRDPNEAAETQQVVRVVGHAAVPSKRVILWLT